MSDAHDVSGMGGGTDGGTNSTPSTTPRPGELPADTPTELPWKRLSPRMLFVHPVQELGKTAPALLVALVAGSGSGHRHVYALGAGALTVVLALLRWYTTTYRVSTELVELRRGLIRRQVSSVPMDRVRAVDLTAHMAHRVLGLTRVTVGTGHAATSHEDELKLDALTRDEAALLRERLLGAARGADRPAEPVERDGAGPPPPADDPALARMRPGWLRYSPFSVSGFVVLVVLACVLEEAGVDVLHLGPVQSLLNGLGGGHGPLPVIETVAGVLLLGTLLNLSQSVLKYWNFALHRRQGGNLETTHGLLTVRAITLEERRVRGVEVGASLPLRLLGGARCLAIATGVRGPQHNAMLVPPGPRDEVVRAAGAVLRDPAALTGPLVPHGAAALRRRYARALAPCALAVAVCGALWWVGDVPLWAWLASALLLPLGALLARDRYRSLGHALTGDYLVIGHGEGVGARRRVALAREGIIGWNVRRSLFQRRAGVLTLTATTAAGRKRYAVRDIGAGEAVRLAEGAVSGLMAPFLVAEPAAGPVPNPAPESVLKPVPEPVPEPAAGPAAAPVADP
ncbi:PH domain-containing protein [Streptomyces varsoviensis]|uniref:PH domain-containing protein n=1 Tax=Streptomyces varsoviensis TaxID=67373 RepID=UPI00068C6A2A|nr:PH domain-containing protein [Streptomyces varsoviensis]